jgi:Tol biopolymer transport system component
MKSIMVILILSLLLVSCGQPTNQSFPTQGETPTPAELNYFVIPLGKYKQVPGCDFNDTPCASGKNGDPVGYHTGIDYWSDPVGNNEPVFASGPGEVVLIQKNGEKDHGMGNAVILEHRTSKIGQPIYTLYAHLQEIDVSITLGKCVNQKTMLGLMGASGYGDPKHWGNTPHLHFEFKTKPDLSNPSPKPDMYWGYIPKNEPNPNPISWGYLNPHDYLDKVSPLECKDWLVEQPATPTITSISPTPLPSLTPSATLTPRPVSFCDLLDAHTIDNRDALAITNYLNQAVVCKNAEAIAALIDDQGATISAGYATDFPVNNTKEEIVSALQNAFSISSPTCIGYAFTTQQQDKLDVYYENIQINWPKYNNELKIEKHAGFLFYKYNGTWRLFGIVPISDVLYTTLVEGTYKACPSSSASEAPTPSTPLPILNARLIAYISDYNVWLMHADGSKPQQITFDGEWGPSKYRAFPTISYGGLHWSPNGEYLVVSRFTQNNQFSIRIIRMRDFNIDILVDNVSGYYDWIPGSQSIIYSDLSSNNQSGNLSILNIETRDVQSYLSASMNERYDQPELSHDSKYILFKINKVDQSQNGEPEPFYGFSAFPKVNIKEIPSALDCNWSPGSDKFICMVEHGGPQCYIYKIYSINGNEIATIPDIGNACYIMNQMQWSPNGTKFVFIGDFPASSLGDVYVMNSDGSELKNLTNDSIMESSPSWSPDGSYIYFNATENGKTNIYRMDINGNNLIQLTNTGNDWGVAWRPQP